MALTPPFNLDWPGDAIFGPGQAEGLGRALGARGRHAALLISDPGLQAAGLVARIEHALSAGGLRHSTYAGVEPNPTARNVAEAHAAWDAGAFDCIVALGGGSAMDTAKGLLAELISGTDVESALEFDFDQPTGPAPLLCVLPTTAGTGSECSMGGVIKGTRKFVIRHRKLQPGLAVMDPELTLSLPPGMTAMTGFDAYCHAIGAWANNQVNPITDEFALQSMGLLLEWLPVAIADGANLEAREKVMLAAYLAGICISQKGVDGMHGLSTPVESLIPITHGETLGIIMPHLLAFNAETLAPRYALAARRLGLAAPETPAAAACDALIAASLSLKSLTGGGDSFAPLGLTRDRIPRLVEMALMSRATTLNGREMTPDAIAALYDAMM